MSFNSNHVATRLHYDIMLSNFNTRTSANPILTFQETASNQIHLFIAHKIIFYQLFVLV